MNRFLYHIIQNPGTQFQVPGASGVRLFTIEYDGCR